MGWEAKPIPIPIPIPRLKYNERYSISYPPSINCKMVLT